MFGSLAYMPVRACQFFKGVLIFFVLYAIINYLKYLFVLFLQCTAQLIALFERGLSF